MSSNGPDNESKSIPGPTIEAYSRSIYKEARKYGFGLVDIVKLINELMDLCGTDGGVTPHPGSSHTDVSTLPADRFLELPIQGPQVTIRAFGGEQDARLLESWLPDRYGRYFVLSCATAQKITVESLTGSPANHLGIVTLPDGRPVGAMAYLDHSRQQRRAELRKLIGDPQSRGRGLAEEATRLWIRYGLTGLGLEKIYVSTLQTQMANIALNEDVGFKVEGLLRNEVLIDGERRDVLRMGLSVANAATGTKPATEDDT